MTTEQGTSLKRQTDNSCGADSEMLAWGLETVVQENIGTRNIHPSDNIPMRRYQLKAGWIWPLLSRRTRKRPFVYASATAASQDLAPLG
ncbi:uncharacterized protein ARMOST_13504 [Armillaria ostoyae]|uniref:Uncharacterized protein n=1 Tax=Armillaria ostoyae TaxID=47428 RepID=A0A284RMX6_ARMOS|nr:uncharacterized protein ARMOST_13504 [Armillaria ostoyae]